MKNIFHFVLKIFLVLILSILFNLIFREKFVSIKGDSTTKITNTAHLLYDNGKSVQDVASNETSTTIESVESVAPPDPGATDSQKNADNSGDQQRSSQVADNSDNSDNSDNNQSTDNSSASDIDTNTGTDTNTSANTDTDTNTNQSQPNPTNSPEQNKKIATNTDLTNHPQEIPGAQKSISKKITDNWPFFTIEMIIFFFIGLIIFKLTANFKA